MNKVLNSPKITVLMPAYNAEQFIIPAVSSILAQEFSSFKLVILDDGSNDRTPEILASFARLDDRITIYTNLSKTGILAARDKLLSYVDTEYFAWMDADDISTPDRLRKQINFLDNNAHIDIVAGSWSILGTDDKTIPYSDPEEIKAAMLVSNPFHNPVMMVRTASIQDLPISLSCSIVVFSSHPLSINAFFLRYQTYFIFTEFILTKKVPQTLKCKEIP